MADRNSDKSTPPASRPSKAPFYVALAVYGAWLVFLVVLAIIQQTT